MLKRSRGQGRNYWDAERRLSEWAHSGGVPFRAAISVFGEFDFLVLCEGEDSAAIGSLVRKVAREIADEVSSVTTYLATDVNDRDKLPEVTQGQKLHCAAIRVLPGTADETRDAIIKLAAQVNTTQLLAIDCVYGDYDVMMLFSCGFDAIADFVHKVGSSVPTIRRMTVMPSAGFRA